MWRSRLLLALIACGFRVLAGRAVYLQGWNNDFLQQKGESRYSRVLEISANRGRITDRHGEALAISTPVKSVWAIPGGSAVRRSQQRAKPAAAAGDAAAGESTSCRTNRAPSSTSSARSRRRRRERVSELHIPGLFQNREYRRYYPGGEVMAHVLGFTGADDAGQEGIELAYQIDAGGEAPAAGA